GKGGSDTVRLLKYFPNTNKWEEFAAPLSLPWTNLGLVPVETHIYAVGGALDSKPTAKLLAYQAIYTVLLPVLE
ncbi:MAG: hypothetical protein ACC700_13300, partial [Anaerolineales bacterium]